MLDLSNNYKIAREAAAQGMVLLKNTDRVLPLQPHCKVGFIGKECLEETVSARALGQAIDRFLEQQTKESRIIFLRRYWFFDSVQEIAKGFGISQSNVKSRLFRMRNQLKKYLQEAQIYV